MSAAGRCLALCFLALLCSCSDSELSGAGTVITVPAPGGSWNRALTEAYYAPFTRETGIEVRLVSGGNDPLSMLAAQKAAGEVQVDLLESDDIMILRDYPEFVDHGLDLPDDLLLPVSFPEKAVPVTSEATPVIVCNQALVVRCPRTYQEFFDDDAFPGDRTLPSIGMDVTADVLEAALLADGVPRDELYPIALDRAFNKLDGIKDSIRLFWTSFSASQDALRSNEAVIALMPDGRANQLSLNFGMDLSISYAGAKSYTLNWVIPKGSPNPEGARAFLRWVLDNPSAQAVLVSMTYYGPVTHRGAAAVESRGISRHTALYLDDTRVRTAEEVERASGWLRDNGQSMMERWNEFVSH